MSKLDSVVKIGGFLMTAWDRWRRWRRLRKEKAREAKAAKLKLTLENWSDKANESRGRCTKDDGCERPNFHPGDCRP